MSKKINKQPIPVEKEKENQDGVVCTLIALFLLSLAGNLINLNTNAQLTEKVRYYARQEKYQQRRENYKNKCTSLEKYTKDVRYYRYYETCYVNGVELQTMEELEKAELHFKLGEAKK